MIDCNNQNTGHYLSNCRSGDGSPPLTNYFLYI